MVAKKFALDFSGVRPGQRSDTSAEEEVEDPGASVPRQGQCQNVGDTDELTSLRRAGAKVKVSMYWTVTGGSLTDKDLWNA